MSTASKEITEYELGSTSLFQPLKVGDVTLKHRIFYPPTTRRRATVDGVPTNYMLEYYGARAKNNGGLLITEGTFISPGAAGFNYAPGIWSEQQTKAWKKIVDEVHKEGTYIAVQLWNLGRAALPEDLKLLGQPFVAPSALYFDESSEKLAKEANLPLQELTLEDIERMKQEYVKAARNAVKEAGFDLIELHDAHGYMLDQFLQPSSNKRTDKYGGSIENRARFVLEVVDLLIEEIGAAKIGIRVSPWATFQGMLGDEEEVHPIAQVGYLLSELEKRKIAYVSTVEPRVSGIFDTGASKELLKLRSNDWIYQIFKSGPILRAGNYLHDRDEKFPLIKRDIAGNDRTMIGVSRFFTSNPDLIERLRNGWELTHYDRNLFYTQDNNGYNTWSRYGEPAISADSAKALEKQEPLA